MQRIPNRLWRIAGVSLASLYAFQYALTPEAWHFIDAADLIFHEAGHAIFRLFGEFVSICMGSGFQILLPFSLTLYFFYQRQRISSAVCLMWTGMNVLNVSVYAKDAIEMRLPLLGGDGVIHDWNYILSALGILSSAPVVASILYALGILLIVLGIAFSFAVTLER